MNWVLVLLSLIATGEMDRGITAEVWDAYSYDTQDYDIVDEEPLPLRVVYKGDTYDSLSFRLLLSPQTAFVMRCDPGARTLADTLAPDYDLTSDAEAAVAAAPAWLRPDLVDNLMQLTSGKQDALADMILNPPDIRLRDEIAFQAAHTSPNYVFAMDLSVMERCLDSLFAIDDELAYVDIVDYGDPETDDDYYSTTRYTTLDNGFHSTFEIPREIYYWYVIMPRITDEKPMIIYDKFWREYLYYDNGTTSYTEGGYPLLRDVLADITYIWDGERHVWAADRPLSPDMCALDAIGWWVSRVVPNQPSGTRYIQPNQIATCHYGNCGETQDIYCAGLRTGLIPSLGTMNINEDHVWDAFWWPSDFSNTDEGIWYECQVDRWGGVTHAADSNTSYDDDRTGSSKHCSMIWNWRADGYQWSTIPMYSDYCTLTVTVYDDDGNPVPNTDIRLWSDPWTGYPSYLGKGFAGLTDRNGVYTTTLGEEQNYTAEVYLQSMGQIIDSASALAGEHFSLACTLTTDYKPKPRELKANPYPPDPVPDLNLALQVEAEYDLGHCPTYVCSEAAKGQGTIKFKQGRLTDFFVTDQAGLSDFLREINFNTYGHFPIEGSLDTAFSVPLDKTCYLVFFNNYGEFGEVISGTVSLIESTDVAEAPGADEHLVLEVMSFASGKGTIMFSLPAAGHACLDVFDLSGRKVTTLVNGQLTAGKHEVYWNGLDNKGAVLSNGVYFISLAAEDSKLVYKTVIVR